MTDNTEIVNLALQTFGHRTTVTAAELSNETSNEAKQANLVFNKTRQRLLRMAPWNCGLNYGELTYITSLPGTSQNQQTGVTQWVKGLPPPPWVYEYQYPVDCLRPCWIIPQQNNEFAAGIPIYPVPVGLLTSTGLGPVVAYKVAIDQFYPVTAAAAFNGGTGYAVGDIVTLPYGSIDEAPIGAPVQLQVTAVVGTSILSVSVVNQVAGSSTPQGGSYFSRQPNQIPQGSTTGNGSGALFNLTFGAKSDQRVILTNQPDALMAWVKDVTDPNVMDPNFIEAWTTILGAHICFALAKDKDTANGLIKLANSKIMEARMTDANEGTVINDIVPDWIRVRGINWNTALAPLNSFNWGGLWETI